jgi:hypothetical protein
VTVQSFPAEVDLGPVPGVPAGLAAYLAEYDQASQLMLRVIETPWVPAAFKPQAFLSGEEHPTSQTVERARQTAVAAGAVAIVYGRSIGFADPFAALQNIYVVNGRPGLYAAAMVAIVQAAGHEVWTEDISDTRAVVCGRRGGNERAERVSVTLDMARKAGWTRNQKYGTEPQAMLYARAASTVCRRIAQDALKGLSRSVEELSDETTAVAPSRTRTVRRSPRAPEPCPPAQTVPAAATVRQEPTREPRAESTRRPPLPGDLPEGDQAPETSRIGAAHWQSINSRMRDLGVTGTGQQAARLAVVSRIAGRPIGKGSDLTAEEGRTVLDTLTGTEGPRIVADVLGWAAAPLQSSETPALVSPDGEPTEDRTAQDPWGPPQGQP